MRKKLLRNVIVILIPLLLIFSIVLSFNFISLSNIYYHIEYEINIPNSNEIIDKVETFEYRHFLKRHDYSGRTLNVSQFNECPSQYIDRECIEYIKNQINQARRRFYLTPGYSHNLNYKFNATEQAKLYLSYSNTTLFNATYDSNKEVFLVPWNDYYSTFYGNWYINFTYIPYVFNQSKTILLESIILINMDLYYSISRYCGEGHRIIQFIALSSDLQIIFIYSDDQHWS
jgi:hypothetical protein